MSHLLDDPTSFVTFFQNDEVAAMIQNERQYKITKAQIDEFDRKLHALAQGVHPGVHPRIAQAQRDAIQSQLAELRSELSAYDAARTARAVWDAAQHGSVASGGEPILRGTKGWER